MSSVATFILFDVGMRNNSSHERWKSSKFPPFLSFAFYLRPWAKYPPEVCLRDMSDGRKGCEKENERIFIFFKDSDRKDHVVQVK